MRTVQYRGSLSSGRYVSGTNCRPYSEYREIKGMKGKWKEDPRFKNAWFFCRAEDSKG